MGQQAQQTDDDVTFDDDYDDVEGAFDDAFSEASKAPDPDDDLEPIENAAGAKARATPSEDDDPPADPALGASPSKDGEGAGGGDVGDDDLWKDAPEDLRAQYEQILRERDELAHKARSDAGRVYALQNRLVELQKVADEATPADQDVPAADVISKALEGEEEWQTFAKEYPEIAKAMGSAMTSAVSAALQQQDARYRPLIDPLVEDVHTRSLREASTQVEEDHPGWEEVVRTDDFKSWLDKQPANVVSLIYSEDAAETAALLDYFAAGTGYQWKQTHEGELDDPSPSRGEDDPNRSASRVRESRQQRLQAAESIPRRGSSPRPTDESDYHGAFQAAVAAAKRQAQRS